jgi:hypothetical protein
MTGRLLAACVLGTIIGVIVGALLISLGVLR